MCRLSGQGLGRRRGGASAPPSSSSARRARKQTVPGRRHHRRGGARGRGDAFELAARLRATGTWLRRRTSSKKPTGTKCPSSGHGSHHVPSRVRARARGLHPVSRRGRASRSVDRGEAGDAHGDARGSIRQSRVETRGPGAVSRPRHRPRRKHPARRRSRQRRASCDTRGPSRGLLPRGVRRRTTCRPHRRRGRRGRRAPRRGGRARERKRPEIHPGFRGTAFASIRDDADETPRERSAWVACSVSTLPSPGGQFDLKMESAAADPTPCDVAIVGCRNRARRGWWPPGTRSRQGDRAGSIRNQTHWNEGQNVAVARGARVHRVQRHGGDGRQGDYLGATVRAGTLGAASWWTSRAVCWRAMQVVADPPTRRGKISMEGLQGLHTGDTVSIDPGKPRISTAICDWTATTPFSSPRDRALFARAVQVVDHACTARTRARGSSPRSPVDGTPARGSTETLRGGWRLVHRPKPGHAHRRGGDQTGAVDGGHRGCTSAARRRSLPSPARDYGQRRLMTGLEAVTKRCSPAARKRRSVRVSKDMTHYIAPIRWLHLKDHAHQRVARRRAGGGRRFGRAEGMEIGLSTCVIAGEAPSGAAGERAVVKLVAKDYGGNPIHRGGALLMLRRACPGRTPSRRRWWITATARTSSDTSSKKCGPLSSPSSRRHSLDGSRGARIARRDRWNSTECRVDAAS